jgi:uncharacterized membrane protein YcaP (DUF421 family)
MNWDALFGVHVPVLELIVRGSCVYWFLFLAFRFLLRRDVGALGVADILLLVIVADASQNAMAGEYKSISEGALLLATIFGWNVFIDHMAFRFRWFERFARPRPRELVRDGRLLERNLARERMTRSELEEKLREHGTLQLSDVRRAYLESDGKVSVITAEGRGDQATEDERPTPGA